MSSEAINTSSYWNAACMLATKAKSCWRATCEPGDLQNRVQALTRTCVGIASISIYYPAAAAGAILGSINPTYTHAINDKVDAMITGLWNSLSYKQKTAASVVGITLCYAAYDHLPSFLHIPGNILATKLGSELVYRNSVKQEMAAKFKEIEQEYQEK